MIACDNRKELFNRIVSEPILYDTEGWEGIPEIAIEFVKSMLQRNPEKRATA